MTLTAPLARILAIEPDPDNGAALQRVLGPHLRADLLIVSCVDEAIASIPARTPDLILTSTFLPPSEELRLTSHLRQSTETWHAQVIALPQFAETAGEDRSDKSGRLLQFGRRRPTLGTLRCDPDQLRRQVEEYLEHACARRLASRDRPGSARLPLLRAEGPVSSPEPALASTASSSIVVASPQDVRAMMPFRLPTDRRRASRKRATDLAGEWGVRLAGGGDVTLVDLSRLGILLETTSQLTPGRIVDLEVLGIDRNVSIGARLVRREVIGARGSGTTYRVAAEFSSALDLLSPPSLPAMPAGHPPKVLSDLLGRVLADANWVSNGATLCARFEEELGGLMRIAEARIRAVPVRPPEGCESLSFGIPGGGPAPLQLQAIFEPGYKPTPLDIRLLKTAATLAAVVLELAPLASGHSPIT